MAIEITGGRPGLPESALHRGNASRGSPTTSYSTGSWRRATPTPSRSWWRGTARWCWASAAASSAIPSDAEDAFQATFLVLVARRPGRSGVASRPGRLVAPGWLAASPSRPTGPPPRALRTGEREGWE